MEPAEQKPRSTETGRVYTWARERGSRGGWSRYLSPVLQTGSLRREKRMHLLSCCMAELGPKVVSSDSDSDSDLSSSSLEDRLLLTGVREPKGAKPYGEAGGSMESPKMGPTRRPSHLLGSQNSLASETRTSSADPQPGTPPWQDPKSPGKRHTWAIPRC
nr:rab effector Noc2 [Neomonachus schauinslandi]